MTASIPGTPAWHAIEPQAALRALAASPHGLSDETAAQRLAEYGRNELAARPTVPAWRRFLRHLNDPLILFLLAAAVLAFALGHLTDASVIVAVVAINAVVGYVQEGRAAQALAALRSMVAPQARVLRAGRSCVLPVAQLVPGDVVLLEPGDRVPADLKILRARALRVDEALLTGESVAADKAAAVDRGDAALAERASMLYAGTLVATGQATGLVVATGAATQMGRIGQLLDSVQEVSTPLLQQTARFGRRFTGFAVACAALLFLYAFLARGYAWLDALMVVVALAVGVVPEGLPAVITITLAIGVRRMAARHAIIRRLPAVETLGATTVICSDKTGTLTRNEMTARSIVTAAGGASATGSGYEPAGMLAPEAGAAAALPAAQAVARIGALCNDAQLRPAGQAWHVEGDPMEGALLALAAKAGVHAEVLQAELPRIDEVPFDARHRYMATLHADPGGGSLLCVKGAPEQILALSRCQLGPDGAEQSLDTRRWETLVAQAGARGERVLGFALRRQADRLEALSQDDVANLCFAGIVGFIDPPRDEAVQAVADCRAAGIAVKMITGDHAATAAAIARQLRLADAPRVVTGARLDAVSDADLPALAAESAVFARTSPEHKLRLVRALQASGETVAMTGDGVNDAPALKQADIGIAMGRKGTEAAKEASEMVLADDNFASIAAAVHEGRAVYDNINKVIAWTLPTNGGEVLAVVVALAFGIALPMTPAQILWVNMVLTVTLGLALAFEPPEAGVMRRPPRRRDAQLLSPFTLWRIALVSVLFTVAALGMYEWTLRRGLGLETARTMVVNTFCVMEIFYLFSVRYLYSTSLSLQGLRGTPAVLAAVGAVIAAQLAFTYLPWLQTVFDSRPLGLLDGAVIILTGVALMLVLELEKLLLRRLGWFDELRRPAPSQPETSP